MHHCPRPRLRASRKRLRAPFAEWINQAERFFALLTERQIKRGAHRSTEELENTIQRYVEIYNRFEPECRHCPRRGRRTPPLHAAPGADPRLGQGPGHRQQAHRRAVRDGRGEALIPCCLAPPPMPDPGRRILRMTAPVRAPSALAVRPPGRHGLCRPPGALDHAGGHGADGFTLRFETRRACRDLHHPHHHRQRRPALRRAGFPLLLVDNCF